MKRTHIIAIVLIAVAVAALLGSMSDSTSYADLTEAIASPGKEYHVVGTLDRSVPVEYDPVSNASLTRFGMTDLKGRKCMVELAKAKPADLGSSERIVLIGTASADGQRFQARDMLLKCPSKYTEENKVK